ncbi:pentapeptide repeat-containing protein [Streptomyces canus]|uniref:pentapeptide repeat-containing protein n=1 Tax=Streptomyces canus TaxID=58343 RepID=UPI00324962B1
MPYVIWRGPYVIDAGHLDEGELRKGSAALVTGIRTAVVAFTAALGAGVALLYTARTYRLTRRGQITDRFTKALERLGSPEIYVRIGGVLALEQIVQDTPEQAATDAARVLGHFVRHRAPKAETQPAAAEASSNPLPTEPEADVQAALTALTRTESRTHIDPRERLDLRGLHLAGARLHGADLTDADLMGATLTDADLSKATLTRANLHSASLTGAQLVEAQFSRAYLVGAKLTGATMFRATLTNADLTAATLTGANLFSATLTEADLTGATLTSANLGSASLTEARLSGAKLTEVSLREATLTKADLRASDLSTAKSLVPAQITSARTDEDTKLPPRFYVSTGASAVS